MNFNFVILRGKHFQIVLHFPLVAQCIVPGAIWRRKGVHPTWPWSGGDRTTGGGGGSGADFSASGGGS